MTTGLVDLPSAVFSDVAKYLALPSRALFASAMTAPASSWCECDENSPRPSAATKVILSSPSEDQNSCCMVLDFEDVDKRLASKLTDNDIDAALLCINAKRNLRILKLSGCVNITGSGLRSLRGSVVLEQIDLCLVGQNEDPWLWPDPLLSEDIVIPILSSIVGADENALKQVQLPRKFCRDQATLMLGPFLKSYNELLQARKLSCSKCARPCKDGSREGLVGFLNMQCPSVILNAQHPWYGLQQFACHKCTKSFCLSSSCSDSCDYCRKKYCADCDQISTCDACEERHCSGCKEMKQCEQCSRSICCWKTCHHCNKTRCGDCTQFYECRGIDCSKSHCSDCVDSKSNDVERCYTCFSEFCSDCRFSKCRKDDWENACLDCLCAIAPVVGIKLEEEIRDDYAKKMRNCETKLTC